MTAIGLTIKLSEGAAESMGDGLYLVLQKDEKGVSQSVALKVTDLETLLAHARERGEVAGSR